MKNLKQEYINKYLSDHGYRRKKFVSTPIREEYQVKIKSIIRLLGIENMDINGYIDTVIEQHFKQYDKIVEQLYDDKLATLLSQKEQ